MLRPRLNLTGLMRAEHGGINYAEIAEMGISPDNILDFSVSTNPFGPPPGISDVISKEIISRYPDSESLTLRQNLADKLGILAENIVAGNGSTELIRLIAAAFFGPGDNVIIPEPTYGDYEIACCLSRASVVKQPLSEDNYFRIDVKDTIKLILKHQARGIFLCNPNNPTGNYLGEKEIKLILTSTRDCLVVLDEAYIAFTANTWPSIKLLDYENVIIIRSMTKDFSLAGIRLGYAIASKNITAFLNSLRPPWNVNSIAQAAGVFALQSEKYLQENKIKIREARKFLIDGLTGLGFSCLPSQVNFFLVRVPDTCKLRQALLRKHILVRDCTSFGLPHYIRLAARPIADCRKLFQAMIEIKAESYYLGSNNGM